MLEIYMQNEISNLQKQKASKVLATKSGLDEKEAREVFFAWFALLILFSTTNVKIDLSAKTTDVDLCRKQKQVNIIAEKAMPRRHEKFVILNCVLLNWILYVFNFDLRGGNIIINQRLISGNIKSITAVLNYD